MRYRNAAMLFENRIALLRAIRGGHNNDDSIRAKCIK